MSCRRIRNPMASQRTGERYIVNLSLCYPLNGITTHFSIYALG